MEAGGEVSGWGAEWREEGGGRVEEASGERLVSGEANGERLVG